MPRKRLCALALAMIGAGVLTPGGCATRGFARDQVAVTQP